uniref:BHLH domain-containing protein n=1 Tax=Hanusia phi TaxID=3032 RepID=A0A7S0E1M9_9CRYP|mmetsp:Transcript_14127/g.32609  ORF Transcript_14127/g.32609 Transcript_14127/m.32609 type:complete len:861 (+) Transcript_14127:245-2827(+)
MEWYEAIQDAAEAPMGTQDMELLQGIVPDAGLDIFGDSRFGQNQLQGPLSIQGRQQNFSNQGNYELPLYGSGDQMSTLGQGVIAGGPSTFGQAGQLMANQNNFMPNSMLGMSDGSGFANNQSMQSNSSRLMPQTGMQGLATGNIQSGMQTNIQTGLHTGMQTGFMGGIGSGVVANRAPMQISQGAVNQGALNTGYVSQAQAPKREAPDSISDEKPAKKAPKRSLAATIERMEKHKILERKRREKTKELMSELQTLIPSVESVQESLTMNTVLEEAIEHLKEQQKNSTQLVVRPKDGDSSGPGAGGLARAFGPSGSGTRDGFNLIQGSADDSLGGLEAAVVPSQNPAAQTPAALAMEKKSSSTAEQLQLGRMPDQEFKYFRLVLMQETLYARMLEGWEQKMGLELVQDSLSLLCLARQGLSQQELEDLLQIKERGLDKQWVDLADALNADLAVRSQGLLGFVYSAFRLAVERRYLRNPEDRRKIQLRLAEYFEKKHGSDAQRAANELPYALESVGEWSRLRECLSSSLDLLYQLYNDKDKGDLLRFWRKGGDIETSGYEAASQLYAQRLKRFEEEGMAPQILWQSCLITARFLGDAGQFKEAENILGKARDLSKELGGGDKFVAEVSLRCAELLNKWAASSPEYSPEMMVRSAFYAKEAADLFAYMTDDASKEDYGTSLYWMGLNFGTLCRIGGGGSWTAQRAHEIAEQALGKCFAVRQEMGASQGKITEVLFGQGVLAFCKAEAMASGHVSPSSPEKAEEETKELREEALQIFNQCYSQFSEIFAENHLEAIKCITMIGLVCRRLERITDALEWCRKEVKVREEVQGELHPRTQQALRVYTELVEKCRNTGGSNGAHAAA